MWRKYQPGQVVSTAGPVARYAHSQYGPQILHENNKYRKTSPDEYSTTPGMMEIWTLYPDNDVAHTPGRTENKRIYIEQAMPKPYVSIQIFIDNMSSLLVFW